MFSFSQIKLYQSCPKKYEFTYLHDFEYEEKDGLPLLQGILLHDALRWLYTTPFLKEKVQDGKMEEELLHYFTTQRNATLPHHNFFDLQAAVVQSAFQQASHYLIQYYHQRFLPSLSLNEMTIGLEQKLTVQNFSVTIDRLTKKEDTFIIYDYKTNKKLTEEEQQFHREQLYLYARAVQENYGIYFSHLECCLEYLALGTTECRIVHKAELQEILEKYSYFAAEITTKKEQLSLTESPDLFPTKKGEMCKWCAFREICPAFAEHSAFSSSGLTEGSIQQLMRTYLKDHDAKKALEIEKETMKAKLEEFLVSHEVQRIFGEKYQITRTTRDNWTIKDELTVRELLKKKGLLEPSLTLDTTKIKKLKEAGKLPADLVQEKESVSLLVKR